MAKDTRRQQVEHDIELYRRLSERLRDLPLPAARAEYELLQRKLVQLRAERRQLDPRRWLID